MDVYNCTITLIGFIVIAMILTDLINKLMLSQHLPHGPAPSHHVDHAPWQPHLGKLKGGGQGVGDELENQEVTLVEGGHHLQNKGEVSDVMCRLL